MISRRTFFVLALLCAAILSLLHGEARAEEKSNDKYKQALTKRLAFIFKDEKLDKTHLGVEVYSLSKQEKLFELNADKALSPASSIKVLTALVALKKLGPDFVYKTDLLVDGTLQKGVLKGNLYLKGSGDPSLVTERIYQLVSEFERSNIKTIEGSLIVDESTFDEEKIDRNRIPTESDKAYNAPVSGLSLNYNTASLYIKPAEFVGSIPRTFVEPDCGYIQVVNKAQTITSSGAEVHQLSVKRSKALRGDVIEVGGKVAYGSSEQIRRFNITQPALYTGMCLRWLLAQKGIRVVGKEIKSQATPLSARLVESFESLPLREIVTLMNKYSNNFIADALVKTLGRELKGAPGTMEKGLQVVLEEATRMNVNTSGFKLVSGSGLTRLNRMSASQFTALLNAAYLDFDVLPELLASLPIAGRDGTLRTRMRGTTAYGRLRGKTGTIDGVSSLVGIVQSRGGELLSFAVLMNDSGKASSSLKPWQDYFAQALAEFNRSTEMKETPEDIAE